MKNPVIKLQRINATKDVDNKAHRNSGFSISCGRGGSHSTISIACD